jgi:hypothetical protein
MWGGSIDYEFSLLYSAGERILTSQSKLSPEKPGSDDSLRSALQALDVVLPTGYFAPHTRSFDWAAHRLA